MTTYWLDASVLIQSRHKFHPRDRVPQFWSWLDEELDSGEVRMPHRAYKEVVAGTDWLVKWCRDRRGRGLDIAHDAAIEKAYRAITAAVQTKHSHVPHQIAEFLRGADGWIVAYAQAREGIVVCEEDRARRHETSNIKIPDVCRLCQPERVKCLDTFGMLDALKAKF